MINLYLTCYDISIINDENGERYILFENADVRYWSIAQYVSLHSLFEKYLKKYGFCHLEVRPRYNETY